MEDLKEQLLHRKEIVEKLLKEEKEQRKSNFLENLEPISKNTHELNRNLYQIFNRFVSNQHGISHSLNLSKEDFFIYFRDVGYQIPPHQFLSFYEKETAHVFKDGIQNSSIENASIFRFFNKNTVLHSKRLHNLFENKEGTILLSKDEEEEILSLYKNFFCSILDMCFLKELDKETTLSFYKTIITMLIRYPQFFKEKINISVFGRNTVESLHKNEPIITKEIMLEIKNLLYSHVGLLLENELYFFTSNRERVMFLYNFSHLIPKKELENLYHVSEEELKRDIPHFLSRKNKQLPEEKMYIDGFLYAMDVLEELKKDL